MADVEVTNISVRMKLTREIQPGTYKSLELGATAVITPDEQGDWRRAQRDLYASLRDQLGALWSANGNGSRALGRQQHNGGGK
jgi:hypothetical protein